MKSLIKLFTTLTLYIPFILLFHLLLTNTYTPVYVY